MANPVITEIKPSKFTQEAKDYVTKKFNLEQFTDEFWDQLEETKRREIIHEITHAVASGDMERQGENFFSLRVDINNADIQTLTSVPGIGESLAKRIVEYRENVHPFKKVVELAAVPGVSENMVQRWAHRLKVEYPKIELPIDLQGGSDKSGSKEINNPDLDQDHGIGEALKFLKNDAYEPGLDTTTLEEGAQGLFSEENSETEEEFIMSLTKESFEDTEKMGGIWEEIKEIEEFKGKLKQRFNDLFTSSDSVSRTGVIEAYKKIQDLVDLVTLLEDGGAGMGLKTTESTLETPAPVQPVEVGVQPEKVKISRPEFLQAIRQVLTEDEIKSIKANMWWADDPDSMRREISQKIQDREPKIKQYVTENNFSDPDVYIFENIAKMVIGMRDLTDLSKKDRVEQWIHEERVKHIIEGLKKGTESDYIRAVKEDIDKMGLTDELTERIKTELLDGFKEYTKLKWFNETEVDGVFDNGEKLLKLFLNTFKQELGLDQPAGEEAKQKKWFASTDGVVASLWEQAKKHRPSLSGLTVIPQKFKDSIYARFGNLQPAEAIKRMGGLGSDVLDTLASGLVPYEGADTDTIDKILDGSLEIQKLEKNFFEDAQSVLQLFKKLDDKQKTSLKDRFFALYPNDDDNRFRILRSYAESLRDFILGFKNNAPSKPEAPQPAAAAQPNPNTAPATPQVRSERAQFDIGAELNKLSSADYADPNKFLAKLTEIANKINVAPAEFLNTHAQEIKAVLGPNLRHIATEQKGNFDPDNQEHRVRYNTLATGYKKDPLLSNLVPDLPATTSQITEAFKDGKVELRDLNVLSPADVYRYIAEARTKNAQIFEATKTHIKTAIADRVARENMKPRQTHKLAMEFLNSPMASGIPQDIYKDTLLGKKYEYSDSTVDRMIPVFQGLYAQARNEQNLEAFWDTKVLPKVLERFAFEVSGEPGTLYKAERMFIEGVQWLKDFDKASGVTDPQGSANGIVKMTIDMVKTDFSSNKLAKDQTNFTYDQVRDSYYKKVQDYLSKEKITFDPQILDRIIDTNAANILNYVNENVKINRIIEEKQEEINQIKQKRWKELAWKGVTIGSAIALVGANVVDYNTAIGLLAAMKGGLTGVYGSPSSQYGMEWSNIITTVGIFGTAIGGLGWAMGWGRENPAKLKEKKELKELDKGKLDAQIQREQKYAELINKIKSEVRGSVASLQQTAGNTFADAVRMSRDGLSNMPNMYTGQNYRRFSY